MGFAILVQLFSCLCGLRALSYRQYALDLKSRIANRRKPAAPPRDSRLIYNERTNSPTLRMSWDVKLPPVGRPLGGSGVSIGGGRWILRAKKSLGLVLGIGLFLSENFTSKVFTMIRNISNSGTSKLTVSIQFWDVFSRSGKIIIEGSSMVAWSRYLNTWNLVDQLYSITITISQKYMA